MAVMPKVSKAALGYIASFGIDPDLVVEDSLTSSGYTTWDGRSGGGIAVRNWPMDFDWLHLCSIFYEMPKRTVRTILIDMDGVIADWGKRWDDILDTHWPESRAPRSAKQKTFDLKAGLDAYDCDVVDMVMNHPFFYRDIEPMPGAAEALNDMVSRGLTVRVCTSPWITNETCASDKLAWLERHIGPGWAKRAIITSDKTLINGDILIDDKPEIKGDAKPNWEHILFDQPYNRAESQRRIESWDSWEHVL